VALRHDPRYRHPFKDAAEARAWLMESRAERIKAATRAFLEGRGR
jgi:hypothetical protein